MANGTITYYLSEEGRKFSLLNGGNGNEIQKAEVPLTKENIDLFDVNSDGEATLTIGSKYSSSKNITDYELEIECGRPRLEELYRNETICFDKIMSGEDLVEFEKNRRIKVKTRKEKLQPEYDRLYKEYKEKIQAEKLAKETEKSKEKLRLENEKLKLQQEKINWINEYGSDYLKKSFSLGYDCQRKYVTERASMEFPFYDLDFDNETGWNSRTSPSEEALDNIISLIENSKVDKDSIQIVWLTAPARNTVDDEEYYNKKIDFEPCEAIVIRNYLTKYDLVRII